MGMIDEGGSPPSQRVIIVHRSQERLLRHLGGFSASLEEAWDVPRDLSLPGLAEAMGVVRSGLNQPLSQLLQNELIQVRVDHVIGGCSRRRQVYHITERGRSWLSEHPEQKKTESPSTGSEGKPHSSGLVGRKEAIAELETTLSEHGGLILGGLSGVGKSALLRAFAAGDSMASGTPRWADVDEFSDAKSVLSAWFPDDASIPTDAEAMIQRATGDTCTSLFVLDYIHRLSSRHQGAMMVFVKAIHAAGHRIVLAGRLPFTGGLDWPVMRLPTLDPQEATSLLGEGLSAEQRFEIAKALGGHPMALQLYQEGDQLPEEGEDVQSFVEHSMLKVLSDEERQALDGMVLFPRPLRSEVVPGEDFIGALDDHALLRWSSASEVEVHNLVRNVRRAMLSEQELTNLHLAAIQHWETHAHDSEFAILRLYHQLALERDDLTDLMGAQFEELVMSEAAALAVIFQRATEQRPDDENLHYWAGRVALHRHEPDHARHHIDHISTSSLKNELQYSLALQDGDAAEAQRLLDAQLGEASSFERSRLLIAAAVQHLEDRIFDQPTGIDVKAIHRMLNEVVLPEALERRTPMTVSLSMIQHTLALVEEDESRALALIDGLASIGEHHDPIVLHMKFKTRLKFEGALEPSSLVKELEQTMASQPTEFHRGVVGLSYAEHLVSAKSDEGVPFFETLPTPESHGMKGAPALRYEARWWYLRGHLYPDTAHVALRESSRCFRQAGCLNAARMVAKRLHRIL